MKSLSRRLFLNQPVAGLCGAALWLAACDVTLQAADNPPQAVPAPCSAALEVGAGALAEGRTVEAAERFAAVAADPQEPPFARGLAGFGLARLAVEKGDREGAQRVLGRLADDAALPGYQRDHARRWQRELERQARGLPGREPSLYRVALPTPGEAAAVLHVAPGGGAGGDGSEAKPFGTWIQARDAVRALKRAQGGRLAQGGVRVVVHGGNYAVAETLRLEAEDSGTAEAPVVYQAKEGEGPVFKSGARVQGWRPVSEAGRRERLEPAARDKVFEADLKALGVVDWGDATELRRRPELFCEGVPQTLARWPNQGFVQMGEMLGKEKVKDGGQEGCKDGKFRYLEERPARWVEEPDVRLYGYWFWDWFEEYQKVSALDPRERTMTLATPYSNYGYRKGQRYFALNLFSEIDQPGEWYLDRTVGKVYWLPPAGVDPNRVETVLSVQAEPVATFQDVSHVWLVGLTFQEGRGDAVRIGGGADCLVAGCTIQRFGGDAVVVQGGARHGVFGVTIHTMGCGGIAMNGGDRAQLRAGGHFVENCTVVDISRLKRTYTPAVLLDGCGNRIAHNRFERMPSSALRVEGNDHCIELNRIGRVVQESDDQGGIDMFGNPLYRGVTIRWNHWFDIGGGTHCGGAGVRLDDMISGVAVYGNVFERCGAVLFGGVQIHGGKENWVDGNLFLNCFAGISYSRWGEQRWLRSVERYLAQASTPPYATRYPELARLRTDWDVNCVSRNVFARCGKVYLRDGGREQSVLNQVTEREVAPPTLADEQALRAQADWRRLLLEPIPWGEIGPYAHPWRAPEPPEPAASAR